MVENLPRNPGSFDMAFLLHVYTQQCIVSRLAGVYRISRKMRR